MTPTEALEILRNATGLLQLNRADHLRVMQAINTLEPLVAKEQEGKNG